MSKEFKRQFVTYIVGAFGLIAGLAWNDAVKSLIEAVYPVSGGGLPAKFIYAIAITVVVAIVSWILIKSGEEKK